MASERPRNMNEPGGDSTGKMEETGECRKAIIVGEMHNDLFYTCNAFTQLENEIVATIDELKEELVNKNRDEIKKTIHDIIERLPKKIPSSHTFIKRGGNGNNSAELFGHLGIPVKLMTVIGRGSGWMVDEIRELGIDVSCVFQLDAVTPVSTIIEDPSTTKIFVAPDLKRAMNFSSVDLKPEHFSGATLVFFTPMASKFKPVLDLIQSNDLDILEVVTIERQAINTLDLLQKVIEKPIDVLFINKRDALGLTLSDTIEDADRVLCNLSRIRIYTMGSEGAAFRSSYFNDVFIPTFDVKVIDRTGAGDAFAAGVLLKIHEEILQHGNFIKRLESAGREKAREIFEQIGRFGSAVAALKISKGRTPTSSEVDSFLASQP